MSNERRPKIRTRRQAGVTIVELSRNFGHQAALTAGLDRAEGDAVVTLDGDGQHPPELIADMVALYRAGYEVVLTQRVTADLPPFKRWTSTAFYRLLSAIGNTRITAGSADYRLLSRPVLEALRQMREYHRFLRGMVAWTGYRTVVLPYAVVRPKSTCESLASSVVQLMVAPNGVIDDTVTFETPLAAVIFVQRANPP